MSGALLRVERLGLATRTGPVFTDVTFTVPRQRLTVVVGPSGSGRSALLLGLSGRMRDLTGRVSWGDHGSAARPRQLRAATSVARLATLVQLEGQLSVGESVTERALMEGVQVDAAEHALARVQELVGVTFARDRLVDELGAYDATLLGVALAVLRPAELVVLDDADRGLDLADQRRLLQTLAGLAAAGQTLVVSTTEPAALPDAAHVVTLPATAAPGPAEPGTDPDLPTAPLTAAPLTAKKPR